MSQPNSVPITNAAEPRVRPPQVSIASLLLVGSLLLEVASSALLVGGLYVYLQIFKVVVVAFLIYMIWLGHNWARLTFTALFALVLIRFAPMLRLFFYAPAAVAIGLAQTLLQVTALYLLFTRPGREWFKRKSGINKPKPLGCGLAAVFVVAGPLAFGSLVDLVRYAFDWHAPITTFWLLAIIFTGFAIGGMAFVLLSKARTRREPTP